MQFECKKKKKKEKKNGIRGRKTGYSPSSRKHTYTILTLLNPISYSKTGVYIIFLIFAQKHRLWVLVERLAESVLTRTHNLCFDQKYEKYQMFQFLLVLKFSIYLNRHVFVMSPLNAGVSLMTSCVHMRM